MMSLYTGTPGSGKSLNVAKKIITWIRTFKSNVIVVNMTVYPQEVYASKWKIRLNYLFKLLGKSPINTDVGRKKRGVIYSLEFDNATPQFFYDYALKFHKPRIEHQTLIVFDESQMAFSPTVVKEKNKENKNYRTDWLKFFTHHRHLGYDIIFVSQFDKLIDAQIRCLFEYNYVHRKVNNYGMAFILTLFKVSLFLQVQYWYGARIRCNAIPFLYSKKYSRIYNSYRLFDEIIGKEGKKIVEKSMEDVA